MHQLTISINYLQILVLIGGFQWTTGAINPTSQTLGGVNLVAYLEKLGGRTTIDGDYLNPLEYFLQDLVPSQFLNQRASNENGTRIQFKEYNLKDRSNDDAMRLNSRELIKRSGFEHTVHEAIADDGYITQVIHLINPLADKRKLRKPPILLEHGAIIDSSVYLLASSIQHFPEKWPRTSDDGPSKSWNRSLGFVLANNGFDVWLAESRGCNNQNRRHIKDLDKSQKFNYWSYTINHVAEYEIKSHMDLVLNQTNSNELSLVSYSMSAQTVLAALAMRPDYAKKVKGYVCMAPIASGAGVSGFGRTFPDKICPLLPESAKTLVLMDDLITRPTRELLSVIFYDPLLRYSFAKVIIQYMLGPSAKWQTLMDLNFIGHIVEKVTLKQIKHLCQIMSSNKIQKLDLGSNKEKLISNSSKPLEYDLSELKIDDWLVVSAANDQWSSQGAYEQLAASVKQSRPSHLIAPGLNHLDLIAGWQNDQFVNLPILEYFEQLENPAVGGYKLPVFGATARSFDLPNIPDISSLLNITQLAGSSQNSKASKKQNAAPDRSESPLGSPMELLEKVTKSIGNLIPGLDNLLIAGKRSVAPVAADAATRGSETESKQSVGEQKSNAPETKPTTPVEQLNSFVEKVIDPSILSPSSLVQSLGGPLSEFLSPKSKKQ